MSYKWPLSRSVMYHRCQVQVTVSVGSVHLCKLARILLYFLLLDFCRGVSTTLSTFCGTAGNPNRRILHWWPCSHPFLQGSQQLPLDPELLQHFHVWVFVSVRYQNTANSGFQNPALHQTADPLGQGGASNWDFESVLVFAWCSLQCWRKEQKVLWGSFWQVRCASTQSRLSLCFSYTICPLQTPAGIQLLPLLTHSWLWRT